MALYFAEAMFQRHFKSIFEVSVISVTAKIMTFTYPKFYDFYLPPTFSSENPIMTGILSNQQKHVTSPPFQLETTFHSTDGVVLHNFAKSNDFHKGKYCGIIKKNSWGPIFVDY